MAESSDPPPTPWERAKSGRRARRSEEDAAKLEGGRRQPASGSRWFAQGDVRANGFLIEDKFTDANSYRITVDDFRKTERQALGTPPGLLPQFRITMPGFKLRVMREEDYLYLVARAGQAEDA